MASYNELKSFDKEVAVCDPDAELVEPWGDSEKVNHEYGIYVINGEAKPVLEDYAAIILAVAHQEFKSWPTQKSENQVVFDVKSVLDKSKVDGRSDL
ncbi:UDP-glucose/GDP-mannose dehydrogenase family protein [Cyclobacterium salsum]|uniref:UDP-glucose/GDP-mannose dehydrogenase family protein n=1 Tax=Cyclobacterium salsum TaxID=2666329 RepID=UPI001F219D98|nr:UDP-glucose/GDP-mannose dehydrogenase family protein [Cyclobacterium salsum]